MKRNNFITLKVLLRLNMIVLLTLSFSIFTIAQKMQLKKDIGTVAYDIGDYGPTVLVSQTDLAAGGVSSQDFEAINDVYDAQGVDDFIVPTGDDWEIVSLMVFGGGAGVPFDLVNVEFFNDAGGIPSATAFTSFMAIAATDDGSGNLTIDLPPGGILLTAGHYWMAVQAANPFSSHGQWYWHRVGTVNNTISHWRNPGDGFGTGFTTWTAEDIVFGTPPNDLAFVLYGSPPPIPLSNWAILVGVFLIAVTMIIGYRRRLLA